MNYAKIVDSALQLFPKNIKLTMLSWTTGETIKKQKIDLNNLPAIFNKPTILEIDGIVWRVLGADPISADDFSFSKKLTLHVQEVSSFASSNSSFNVPTIPDKGPLCCGIAIFDDFILDLDNDDWRQLELLPCTMLPVLQDEINEVSNILHSTDIKNKLLGYDHQHLRIKTGNQNLAIDFDEFCSTIDGAEKGCIRMKTGEFVQHGIAVRSVNYIWYGLMADNIISDLNIYKYDCIDDELFRILTKYDLTLVDWCNGQIIAT